MKNKYYSFILFFMVLIVYTEAKGQLGLGNDAYKWEGTKNGVDYYSLRPTNVTVTPQWIPPSSYVSPSPKHISDWTLPIEGDFKNLNGVEYFASIKEGVAYRDKHKEKIGHYNDKQELLNEQGTLEPFSHSDTWTGYWIDGKLNGHGTWKTSLSSYDGEWKDWKFDGQGTYTWIDWYGVSNTYIGTFKAGKMDGYGTLKTPTKSYEGEWKDDHLVGGASSNNLNGPGSYTSSDGVKYEGNFKNGKIDGHGTETTPTTKWSGEWVDGQLNGHGSYKTATTSYDGEWKDGNMNGKGTFIYGPGDMYVGEWKNNIEEGHGTRTYSDGSKYDGSYKNRSWFGEGVYTSVNGVKCYGNWFNDGKPMNCKYKEVYANGKTRMEGNYVDSFLDGNVKIFYETGKIQWDENYKKGVLEGETKKYYEEGEIEQDMYYKNGVLDGAYKSYYENGMLWSDYVYREGKLWNTIADNMPDGKPTGSNVKNGNGVTYQQSPDGNVIVSKTTYQNGVVVKTEAIPAK